MGRVIRTLGFTVAGIVSLFSRLALVLACTFVHFLLVVLADTVLPVAPLVGRTGLHTRGLVVLLRETVLAFTHAILVILVQATSLLGGFLLRRFIDVTFAALVAASRWATNTVPIDGSSRTTLAVVPA